MGTSAKHAVAVAGWHPGLLANRSDGGVEGGRDPPADGVALDETLDETADRTGGVGPHQHRMANRLGGLARVVPGLPRRRSWAMAWSTTAS